MFWGLGIYQIWLPQVLSVILAVVCNYAWAEKYNQVAETFDQRYKDLQICKTPPLSLSITYSARWSFPFILGPLQSALIINISSVFPASREHRSAPPPFQKKEMKKAHFNFESAQATLESIYTPSPPPKGTPLGLGFKEAKKTVENSFGIYNFQYISRRWWNVANQAGSFLRNKILEMVRSNVFSASRFSFVVSSNDLEVELTFGDVLEYQFAF